MEETKTVLVFCANEQKETAHTLDIDGAGEIVVTCVECERALKFPAGTDAEGLKEAFAAHKKANEGQLSVASIEAHKAKLIEDLTGEKAEPASV